MKQQEIFPITEKDFSSLILNVISEQSRDKQNRN